MLVASFSKRSCALLLTYIALLLIAVTVTASRPKPHGKHEGTKPEPVMDSTTGSTTAPKTDKTDMGEPAPGNFSSSKVQVILARYSEQLDHLDWLTKYTHTIYNRGKDIEVPFKLNEVKVYTNFGKESFIYLDHIIEHYDNLAEIMVFSQASQDFGNYSNANFQRDVEGLATGDIQFSIESDGFMFLLPYCFTALVEENRFVPWFNSLYGPYAHKLLVYGYDNILHAGVNQAVLRFGPTGCFTVRREAVYRHSRAYYSDLRDRLSYALDPAIGHFFERSWSVVFSSSCAHHPVDYYCHYDKEVSNKCKCLGMKWSINYQSFACSNKPGDNRSVGAGDGENPYPLFHEMEEDEYLELFIK